MKAYVPRMNLTAMRVLTLNVCLLNVYALGTTMALQEVMGWGTASSSCNFSLAMRDPEITG